MSDTECLSEKMCLERSLYCPMSLIVPILSALWVVGCYCIRYGSCEYANMGQACCQHVVRRLCALWPYLVWLLGGRGGCEEGGGWTHIY